MSLGQADRLYVASVARGPVRSCSRRRGFQPLSSGAGIRKAAEKIHQRAAVAWKGGYFSGTLWHKFRSELRQFRVGQASVPVMHAMIWLMEQSESYEASQRPFVVVSSFAMIPTATETVLATAGDLRRTWHRPTRSRARDG